MASTIRVAPPYSLIFVMDPDTDDIPECSGGKSLWATPSCIAVTCLMFQDGDTEVSLGSAREVDPGGRPIFDGPLETPNRIVVVSTAEAKTLLKAAVPSQSTRVRIWTNHPSEPDKIAVGLG